MDVAAAAAEGGRWRRRCCWCRSWWVAETGSARAAERARSRDRRAAQARATGARPSRGEGRAVRPAGRLPLRPPEGARATRSPPAPPPRAARLRPSLPGSRHASGLRADRRAHARAPWRTRTPASWGCSLCLVQGSPPCPRGFEAERCASPCWLFSSPLQTLQAVLVGLPRPPAGISQNVVLAFFSPPFFLGVMAKVNYFLDKSS